MLRVSVTALRESGYYDQNIVPLVALLNVVALSVLTFQDSDFFHRALITLNIAFVEMSIRMTADSHLPSQRLDRHKAVDRDFEEIEAECLLPLTTWTKQQQQEQQPPLSLNRKRGAAGAATASPMPKLVARSPMLQQLGGVYSGSGSVRHKKHNSLDASPFLCIYICYRCQSWPYHRSSQWFGKLSWYLSNGLSSRRYIAIGSVLIVNNPPPRMLVPAGSVDTKSIHHHNRLSIKLYNPTSKLFPPLEVVDGFHTCLVIVLPEVPPDWQ
ncbi:hypothetical protein IV203_034388 [Nitzschia inconspicua]|uniref:Uncharacterized protein n=1 Tax=Nitzschia inconspicua TaxID=303405 RepID=A0A9K3Q9Q4_9STRA|nr:hypothetical protein IV203_034388 [Nitzschia inconspicua]